MSTLTFTPAPYARSRAVRPVLTTLQTVLGHLTQSWSTWQAERAMARLDDAALNDMGIVRSEISRAVREGRPQR